MRLLALYLLLAAVPAFASGLSEQDAVQRGLTQPRVSTLIDARRAAAEGAASAVGRWDNPELEYSEESLDLPGGDSSDEFLWLRQRFNVAGARGLERRAARLNLEGQYARIDLERRELAREIRSLYYDVLEARQRFSAQNAWRSRLGELTAAVEARAEAGDAARYDALRLHQELALVDAEVRQAAAELESAREALFELIGGDPVGLSGGLLPPESEYSVARLVERHPRVQALQAEANSAETRSRVARRDAWPDVTLGVGRRQLDEGELDAEGGLIAIGVELPLFDRSQGEFQAAQNEARAIRAESSLVRSRLTSQAREALRLLAVRRAAAVELKTEAAGGGSLPSIAEAAYAAGEIDVMALIDAHRTELAIERESTTLARAARAAYIQLQYLSGEP